MEKEPALLLVEIVCEVEDCKHTNNCELNIHNNSDTYRDKLFWRFN